MISALYRVIVPSSSAAAVPGSRVCRVWARSIRCPARPRDSASAYATWSAVNSASSGAGLRRASSAMAASLRARGVGLDPVPRAHHPDQLGLRHPGEPAVLAGGGVGGDRQGRAARQHVQRHPGAERRRGLDRLAGEDPRGAGLARAPPPGGGRLHGEQLIGGGLADLGQLLRGERLEVLVLVLAGAPRPARRPGPAIASSSAAVIGSGRVQAGSSSHSGSAGTGSGGMYHHPFGMMIFIEHNSVLRLIFLSFQEYILGGGLRLSEAAGAGSAGGMYLSLPGARWSRGPRGPGAAGGVRRGGPGRPPGPAGCGRRGARPRSRRCRRW